MKTIQKIVLTGIAGTLATDVWTFLLKLLGVHSHGLLLVGRWFISHLNAGLQNSLSDKVLLVGWTAHYCLGILFAFLPVLIYGKRWLQNPTFPKAATVGLVSFIISLVIIQPLLNFGIAFSRFTDQPVILLKVVLFHLIYSIGLYFAALKLQSTGTATKNLEHDTHKA